MSSLVVAGKILEYGPKFVAVAFPWIYAKWNRIRQRPMVWIRREEGAVSIETCGETPIEKLGLRVIADGVLEENAASCATRVFTGLVVSKVGTNELRVWLDRFGSHDQLTILSSGKIRIQVLSSEAVPVKGKPTRSIARWDYVVAALTALAFAAIVMPPLQAFLLFPATIQQNQQGENLLLGDLLVALGFWSSSASILLLLSTLLLPGRARVFRLEQEIAI